VTVNALHTKQEIDHFVDALIGTRSAFTRRATASGAKGITSQMDDANKDQNATGMAPLGLDRPSNDIGQVSN
jgi:hypothetical protein